MTTFNITIDNAGILDTFNRLRAAAADLTPAMRAVAGLLEDRTAENFAKQSGPLGKWPARKSTPRDKKRGIGQLLVDTARLKNSVTSKHGSDFAEVGSNVIYAAIHQLGGDIERAAYSKQVRHRTDAKGTLLKSEHFNGKGLIFAKDSHKRALTRWFEVGAHTVHIPARPFLPFVGTRLQDGVEPAILEILNRHLAGK